MKLHALHGLDIGGTLYAMRSMTGTVWLIVSGHVVAAALMVAGALVLGALMHTRRRSSRRYAGRFR